MYHSDASGRLLLRKGIKAADGADAVYGASGWGSSSIHLLVGTPDVNGDAVPGVWTARTDGTVRFYAGGRTVLSGSGTGVIGTASHWRTRIAPSGEPHDRRRNGRGPSEASSDGPRPFRASAP